MDKNLKYYDVTGMSCAACSARVEKAVRAVGGVEKCSVNLLTCDMIVEGDADAVEIVKAVTDAGYGASLKGNEQKSAKNTDELNDDMSGMKQRLGLSLFFLIILMYVSMGHTMWNMPLPNFFNNNYVAIGLLQLILTSVIMVINQKFFISGFKGLIKKAPNMDTLVALGSVAAFAYSTVALFAMTKSEYAAHHLLHELYFESAGTILTLITLGKMLEARSKGKTTDAIKKLVSLAPKTAVVIRDGIEMTIQTDDVLIGDIFIVRSGENIPVDGKILEGVCAVNESSLTGESIPVDKMGGDLVSSGTVNLSGYIKCEATKVGEDTTLSQIIKLVSEASSSKAPISKIADKVSGVFVPTVIIISVITTLVWLFSGNTVGFSLARGISVLVISCPCALGLATPVAIMVGSGVGAKCGIMFKTAASLEQAGKVKTVALDKTGTITVGKPKVTDVIPVGVLENELIKYAYSLEYKSEHPLANAIVDYGKENNIDLIENDNFQVFPGNGLCATIDDDVVYGGNQKFISNYADVDDEINKRAESLSSQGKTPLFFAKGSLLLGIIAVADTIKEDSVSAVSELKKMGVKTIMLTGDNKRTADAIGKAVGVDEIISEVLPENKESIIRDLKKNGTVMMVGDGINDAPALTSADTGIAIGAGADIAIDAADVVLIKNSLRDVPGAINLSRKVLMNIKENLFWAFIYNVVGIPIAAGVLIPFFNIRLSPMFAALAMSLSSFCVVSNALRLNLVDVYNTKKKEKREKVMKKRIKIDGMMCGHCEATVKKALESIPEVEMADVSHRDGVAVITLKNEVLDDVIIKIIEDKDFKVIGID